MRYEVKNENGRIRVFCNEKKVYITKDVPTVDIANEIASDFNDMENKDFRPIGMPDFSNKQVTN